MAAYGDTPPLSCEEASSSSCGRSHARAMLSIGRVGDSTASPSRAGSHARVQRKQLGKPTSKVVACANVAVSRLSRLCTCVVPERGCPRMKTGRGFSGVRDCAAAGGREKGSETDG